MNTLAGSYETAQHCGRPSTDITSEEHPVAATHSNVSPIRTTGSTAGPASPTINTPIATIWIAVFHLARRETGRPTRSPARYSRNPDTRISRQRMTKAGNKFGDSPPKKG